jgi:hypothetical protein
MCVITTLLLFADKTPSEIDQMSGTNIIVRYCTALVVGLLTEFCIRFIGQQLKKRQLLYENIIKNKPSVLNWLKFFSVFCFLGSCLPMSALSILFSVFILQHNISILYLIKLSFLTFLTAGIFLGIVLYLIAIFQSRKKNNVL